jgi:hypothetical protein
VIDLRLREVAILHLAQDFEAASSAALRLDPCVEVLFPGSDYHSVPRSPRKQNSKLLITRELKFEISREPIAELLRISAEKQKGHGFRHALSYDLYI